MKISKVFKIGENDYKKALKNGAKSIIGADYTSPYSAARTRILTAEVKDLGDGSYWLACEMEVD